MKKKDKKAVALEFLFWLIVGVVVLVIVIFIIMILIGKGGAAIEFIKNLLRLNFLLVINKNKKLSLGNRIFKFNNK